MLRRRVAAGFSIIELLIVIALMAILASAVLPKSGTNVYDQLVCAGRVLATDMAYARSLAVTNGSRYRVTFDLDNNRYVLGHSGASAALDVLPYSMFRKLADPPDQHIVDLADLPLMGATVKLTAVAKVAGSLESTDHVEFGPLGETTRSQPTRIWLSTGEGPAKRFITLEINPVTGIAALGEFSGTEPPAHLLGG